MTSSPTVLEEKTSWTVFIQRMSVLLVKFQVDGYDNKKNVTLMTEKFSVWQVCRLTAQAVCLGIGFMSHLPSFLSSYHRTLTATPPDQHALR